MPFQSFEVLLAPISCSAYNFKIFSTYLYIYFVKINQKRELENLCAERRHRICKAEIQIDMFDIRTGKNFKPRGETTLNSYISENMHTRVS